MREIPFHKCSLITLVLVLSYPLGLWYLRVNYKLAVKCFDKSRSNFQNEIARFACNNVQKTFISSVNSIADVTRSKEMFFHPLTAVVITLDVSNFRTVRRCL